MLPLRVGPLRRKLMMKTHSRRQSSNEAQSTKIHNPNKTGFIHQSQPRFLQMKLVVDLCNSQIKIKNHTTVPGYFMPFSKTTLEAEVAWLVSQVSTLLKNNNAFH